MPKERRIDFRILGPLEVSEEGRPLQLGRGKQRALLALLVLHANEVVAQERLVDELWGETPPPTALTALHGYVSRLRKLLGSDRLETITPGYRLRVEAGELDRDRLTALSDEGRYVEALALWRGSPLADLAYEPFAQAHIGRLEELHLSTLEARIDDDLESGRHAEVVGELEALVKQHPLRERLRAQLMLALYRSGRQAEALEAFRSARATLVDELGIEPGEELKALQKQILAQDSALSVLPPVPVAESTPSPRRARRLPRRRLLAGLAVLGVAIAAGAAATALRDDDPPAAIPLANSVIEIDPGTNKIVSVVGVGKGAFGLAMVGRILWVANRNDDTLTRVDTRSHVARTYGGFASPLALALDGSRVWIGSDSSNQVVAIDGETGVVLEQLRLPSKPASYLAAGAGSLWVSHDGLYGFFRNVPSTMSRVDLRTRKVTTIHLGVGAWATSVAYGHGAAWVTLSGKGDLIRIDDGDGSRRRVAIGPVPLAVAASDAVWATSYGSNTVRRVNAVTGEVGEVVHVGRQPFAVAVGAGAVWVANHADCSVSRIDTATGDVVATIPTHFFPSAVTVGAGRIWVALLAKRWEGTGSRSPGCAGAPGTR